MITMETKHNAFTEPIVEMLNHCKDTLVLKHAEYATEDEFHNFNQAAELLNTTPEKALAGMMVKHTVSVYDMIENTTKPDADVMRKEQLAIWKEKICDSINYLLILYAMECQKANG